MARSPIARRPAGRRTVTLHRPARQHFSIDFEPVAAAGSSPAAAGPSLSASPAHEETNTEVTSVGFWALLPAAERERLGLRLSRLVRKALRPLDIKEDR